jgi:hypothetical protein
LDVEETSRTLHSRSTNFVDSSSYSSVRKTGAEGSLASRVLSLVGRENATKEDFLDSFFGQVDFLDSSYIRQSISTVKPKYGISRDLIGRYP